MSNSKNGEKGYTLCDDNSKRDFVFLNGFALAMREGSEESLCRESSFARPALHAGACTQEDKFCFYKIQQWNANHCKRAGIIN